MLAALPFDRRPFLERPCLAWLLLLLLLLLLCVAAVGAAALVASCFAVLVA
eukprot:COSAG01_NODE_62145_length_286_cov_0.743316_1_plen_50_part_10